MSKEIDRMVDPKFSKEVDRKGNPKFSKEERDLRKKLSYEVLLKDKYDDFLNSAMNLEPKMVLSIFKRMKLFKYFINNVSADKIISFLNRSPTFVGKLVISRLVRIFDQHTEPVLRLVKTIACDKNILWKYEYMDYFNYLIPEDKIKYFFEPPRLPTHQDLIDFYFSDTPPKPSEYIDITCIEANLIVYRSSFVKYVFEHLKSIIKRHELVVSKFLNMCVPFRSALKKYKKEKEEILRILESVEWFEFFDWRNSAGCSALHDCGIATEKDMYKVLCNKADSVNFYNVKVNAHLNRMMFVIYNLKKDPMKKAEQVLWSKFEEALGSYKSTVASYLEWIYTSNHCFIWFPYQRSLDLFRMQVKEAIADKYDSMNSRAANAFLKKLAENIGDLRLHFDSDFCDNILLEYWVVNTSASVLLLNSDIFYHLSHENQLVTLMELSNIDMIARCLEHMFPGKKFYSDTFFYEKGKVTLPAKYFDKSSQTWTMELSYSHPVLHLVTTRASQFDILIKFANKLADKAKETEKVMYVDILKEVVSICCYMSINRASFNLHGYIETLFSPVILLVLSKSMTHTEFFNTYIEQFNIVKNGHSVYMSIVTHIMQSFYDDDSSSFRISLFELVLSKIDHAIHHFNNFNCGVVHSFINKQLKGVLVMKFDMNVKKVLDAKYTPKKIGSFFDCSSVVPRPNVPDFCKIKTELLMLTSNVLLHKFFLRFKPLMEEAEPNDITKKFLSSIKPVHPKKLVFPIKSSDDGSFSLTTTGYTGQILAKIPFFADKKYLHGDDNFYNFLKLCKVNDTIDIVFRANIDNIGKSQRPLAHSVFDILTEYHDIVENSYAVFVSTGDLFIKSLTELLTSLYVSYPSADYKYAIDIVSIILRMSTGLPENPIFKISPLPDLKKKKSQKKKSSGTTGYSGFRSYISRLLSLYMSSKNQVDLTSIYKVIESISKSPQIFTEIHGNTEELYKFDFLIVQMVLRNAKLFESGGKFSAQDIAGFTGADMCFIHLLNIPLLSSRVCYILKNRLLTKQDGYKTKLVSFMASCLHAFSSDEFGLSLSITAAKGFVSMLFMCSGGFVRTSDEVISCIQALSTYPQLHFDVGYTVMKCIFTHWVSLSIMVNDIDMESLEPLIDVVCNICGKNVSKYIYIMGCVDQGAYSKISERYDSISALFDSESHQFVEIPSRNEWKYVIDRILLSLLDSFDIKERVVTDLMCEVLSVHQSSEFNKSVRHSLSRFMKFSSDGGYCSVHMTKYLLSLYLSKQNEELVDLRNEVFNFLVTSNCDIIKNGLTAHYESIIKKTYPSDYERAVSNINGFTSIIFDFFRKKLTLSEAQFAVKSVRVIYEELKSTNVIPLLNTECYKLEYLADDRFALQYQRTLASTIQYLNDFGGKVPVFALPSKVEQDELPLLKDSNILLTFSVLTYELGKAAGEFLSNCDDPRKYVYLLKYKQRTFANTQ